jgi:hypothetical protein
VAEGAPRGEAAAGLALVRAGRQCMMAAVADVGGCLSSLLHAWARRLGPPVAWVEVQDLPEGVALAAAVAAPPHALEGGILDWVPEWLSRVRRAPSWALVL